LVPGAAEKKEGVANYFFWFYVVRWPFRESFNLKWNEVKMEFQITSGRGRKDLRPPAALELVREDRNKNHDQDDCFSGL